jgi:DNA-binding IscR family transcriptional regulator
MSDSQRFPVAAHALTYLANRDAMTPERAVSSAALAASMPTNPVVVRRVTAMLARAGLIGTRAGASGGAWLCRPPASITLDLVLRAVGGCANLGCPPPGVKGCPVGERIPDAVRGVLEAVDQAALQSLAKVTVADLLRTAQTAPAPVASAPAPVA